MIEKITKYLYENNAKKINEIIDVVNTMTLADTQGAVSRIQEYLSSLVSTVSPGTEDGTIAITKGDTTTDVSVRGLKSAAFTESEDYAEADHTHTSDNVTAMTGYQKANVTAAINVTDSLNGALGKLERNLDEKLPKTGTAARATADAAGNIISATYVPLSSIGNEANKIPRYNADGHLILPDGTEVFTTNDEVSIPGSDNSSSSGEPTHFIGINSDDSTDSNYNGGGAVGVDSIVIGKDAKAYEENAIAMGITATANGYETIAIGRDAYSNGENSISIGVQANTTNSGSISIGNNALTYGEDCIAIGTNADSNVDSNENAYGNIAIGSTARVSQGVTSIAIGNHASSFGTNAIAIGAADEDNNSTMAESNYTVALGAGANAKASYGIAIGTGVQAGTDFDLHGPLAIAIGTNVTVARQGIVIGANSSVPRDHSIVIGDGSTAQNPPYLRKLIMPEDNEASAIILGHSSNTIGYCDNAICVGNQSSAEGENTIAIGHIAKANGDGSIVIGANTITNAIWDEEEYGADYSIAIGNSAKCHGYASIAIGPGVNVYDDYCDFSVAIGCDTEVTAENAIAIGKGAKVNYVIDGIAIGQGAQVTGGDDCVAIGNESVAYEFHEFSIGKPAYGGESEFTRRITHVSNGVNDSDAVTLGQVKAMIAALRQELGG